MIDKEFNLHGSTTCLIAYGAAIVAIVVWTYAFVTEDAMLGQFGLVLGIVAGVATVRSYFVVHDRRVREGMVMLARGGEGRGDGRGEGGVTPLR